ncbi:hypothetical protein AMJ80_00710 [bacterium SM23_31]|nr:MAG: hypothetical protein AMJ80_00710 [bacterium SM23_31]
MDLSEYRSEFPILKNKIYLNTCSLGALSRRSREYVKTYLAQWDEFGASAWYSLWMNDIAAVRNMIAEILHADKDEIALGHSISTLLSTVASCFRYDDREKIVVTELDFPTANYQWFAKESLGARIEMLSSPDSVHIPLEKFQEAIDDKTLLVSTSHVFFTSGQIQDIATINTIARRHGALCIVDAYQSVGQVPVRVHDMGIDILVSGGLKWLLGGSGITFLYVRKDLASSLQPSSIGWFGVSNQFEFAPDRINLIDSTRRFETGTPSVAALAAFKGGLEIILEIGLENIHKAAKQISEELVERLKKAGFNPCVAENPTERSAIVMVPHPDPSSAVGALSKRNIIVDFRKGCIRVSPYFYNSSEDIEKFVFALKEIS